VLEVAVSEAPIPGLVFKVGNHHAAGCGPPPAIDGDSSNRYSSYFENQWGEQAVFVYDYETDEATLWMGDASWDKPIRVVDPKAPGIILGASEALWLAACWKAITPTREYLRAEHNSATADRGA
jgi:hypothetical protein